MELDTYGAMLSIRYNTMQLGKHCIVVERQLSLKGRSAIAEQAWLTYVEDVKDSHEFLLP
jgi:hypothetical protein